MDDLIRTKNKNLKLNLEETLTFNNAKSNHITVVQVLI
jgi:hypothetical protein